MREKTVSIIGTAIKRPVTKRNGEPNLAPLPMDSDPLIRGGKSLRLFRLGKTDMEKLRAGDEWEVRVVKFIVTDKKDDANPRIIILKGELIRGWHRHSYCKDGEWVTEEGEIGTGEESKIVEKISAYRDEIPYSTEDGKVAIVEKIWAGAAAKLVRQWIIRFTSLEEWRKERKEIWTYRGNIPANAAFVTFEALDFSDLTPDPLPKGTRIRRHAPAH